MATFYLGQSVRVVQAPAYPEFVGTVAVVIEVGPSITFREYQVRCIDGKSYYCDSCHIEPLQNSDGRQIVRWQDCPWMPESLREMA